MVRTNTTRYFVHLPKHDNKFSQVIKNRGQRVDKYGKLLAYYLKLFSVIFDESILSR